MSQVDLKKKYLRRAHNLIHQGSSSSGKRGSGKLQASVEPFQSATGWRRPHSQNRDPPQDDCSDSCSDPASLGSHRSSLSQLTSDPYPPSSLGAEKKSPEMKPLEMRPLFSSSTINSPQASNFPQATLNSNSTFVSTTPTSYSTASMTVSDALLHSTPNTPQSPSITGLQSQLKVQTNVNRELKRLLVASVGNDLEHRLQQMVQEKVELSRDLDHSLQQVITNSEEIDQVSIECDIWRSKFIASRLMIDELASWKADLSLQLREARRALKQMLTEREEMCRDLRQCRGNLQRAGAVTGGGGGGRGVGGGRGGGGGLQVTARGAKVATVPPIQYSSKSELNTMGEPLVRGTILDLVHQNVSIARDLSNMLCQGRQFDSTGSYIPVLTEPLDVVVDLTPGERLAKRVMTSRPDVSRPRHGASSLPKLLVSVADLTHHRAAKTAVSVSSTISTSLSPLSRRLLKFGARALEDPFSIPFNCSHCKGRIMVV